MNYTVKIFQQRDTHEWDTYVQSKKSAILYHLAGWKNIFEKTYGHKTYYLIARQECSQPIKPNNPHKISLNSVVGILPLVHLKHYIFGNNLISLPFFDMGGLLAENIDVEKELIYEATKLGQNIKADNIELRHTYSLPWLDSNPNHTSNNNSKTSTTIFSCNTLSHKVRMVLSLPDSSEELIKSFKSKLRSQIKKPIKEGLTSKFGGKELLDEFYYVFSVNMRDLGSPVHSKKMISNVLEQFSENAKIIIVKKDNTPMACSLIVGFKSTLGNPWASSLRKFSGLSPNMLLYWTMLEYACDNGYKYFDFGRSTPGEGTYKFKAQWGAKPQQLYWHNISLNGQKPDAGSIEKSKYDKAIQYWQKLPVPVTKLIGPILRKHIDL